MSKVASASTNVTIRKESRLVLARVLLRYTSSKALPHGLGRLGTRAPVFLAWALCPGIVPETGEACPLRRYLGRRGGGSGRDPLSQTLRSSLICPLLAKNCQSTVLAFATPFSSTHRRIDALGFLKKRLSNPNIWQHEKLSNTYTNLPSTWETLWILCGRLW